MLKNEKISTQKFDQICENVYKFNVETRIKYNNNNYILLQKALMKNTLKPF